MQKSHTGYFRPPFVTHPLFPIRHTTSPPRAPLPISQGYSPTLNRMLLCNALISAFDIGGGGHIEGGGGHTEGGGGHSELSGLNLNRLSLVEVSNSQGDLSHVGVSHGALSRGGLSQGVSPSEVELALRAELLGYFLLLHISQPDELSARLLASPPSLCTTPPVRFALRIAGAIARADARELEHEIKAAPLLAAACVLHVLPEHRSRVLSQCNAAFTAREPFAAAVLGRHLLLEPQAAERCAEAHGLERTTAPVATGAAGAGDVHEGRGLQLHGKGKTRLRPRQEQPQLPPPALMERLARLESDPEQTKLFELLTSEVREVPAC